jgi:glycosyltransferase 2 family protein
MLTFFQRHATWFKWLLAIGLLTALFWFHRQGLTELSQREIGWSFFGAAAVMRLVSLGLTFLRWRMLVVGIGLPFRVRDAFRLGLLGEACNLMGPGSTGGDLLKAVWLAKDYPGRRASAAATVLLDRVLGLWSLFVVGALATLIPSATTLGTEMQWALWMLWGGAVAGLVGIGLLLLPAVTHSRLMHWLTTWRGVGRIVRELMDSIALYQQQPRAIVLAAALSVSVHVGFLTSFALCAVALNGDRPIPGYVDHLVGLPLPEALAAIVPTPNGVGALEWAVTWFYRQHQQSVDPESSPDQLKDAQTNGLFTALAYRATVLIGGGIGLVYYFATRRKAIQDQPGGPTVSAGDK